MPPEPTKGKLRRKTSRKELDEYRFDGGHAREIEDKRNSGQISCAECRRLKIKCDKQIPCQSCQRRGCAALCPNGSLATGQGTRFVLAATEHLHLRIAKMNERIRLLEDALGELQSQCSTEPHPLLHNDSLGVNPKDDEASTPGDLTGPQSLPAEILSSFGTLSITDNGTARFFGPTGGSECLLMADKILPRQEIDSDFQRDSLSPPVPQKVPRFSKDFPFTPVGTVAEVRADIENRYMPNWERASYLTETYCEQAAWIFRGVSREQIMEELLPRYYSKGSLKATDGTKHTHDLALLFLIFAMGALVDLKQLSGNSEAEHYHQIARAAIYLQPVLEKPSVETIQALQLLGLYNAMSGNELNSEDASMETTWSLIIMAAHLSQTMGLHRDGKRWGLPEKLLHRRRVLFWDLFVSDVWGSLSNGRPPSFSLPYIDCQFPDTGHTRGKSDDDPDVQFGTWHFRFAYECVAEVAVRTLAAEAPSYTTIMELDHKIRKFPIPGPSAQLVTSPASPMLSTINEHEVGPTEYMGRFVMAHAQEVLLLYIHRSFFAQAIIEYPADPSKSPYAFSFIASYRASSTILKIVGDQYMAHPTLCERFWAIWTFAFSAAIVFGTIVTRGPRSPMASIAIKELDAACVLFKKAARQNRRAAKALPILVNLSEKAHNALTAARDDKGSDQLGQHWTVDAEVEDELDIFAVRTRFVSTKRLPETKQVPDGMASGSIEPRANLSEQPVVHPYRLEPTTTSVDGWAHADRDDVRYQSRPLPEYIDECVQPQMVAQWRPRRSHYPYASDHHHSHPPPSIAQHPPSVPHQHPPPVSQHPPPHERAPVTDAPTYSWSSHTPHTPTHFRSSSSTFSGSSSHSHSHSHSDSHSPSFHPYDQSAYHPPSHQAHVPPAPPELTELGLVSHESRLDERWTSFMRDSGYFEGFGYGR
ncbi:hypothetical protein PAXRUDRAFT_827363 [Paxillus rubicundulus Ve08.2h10]|uniref:Zn(2)-C6 fungal-type domain-containing protein n=1 Tax=Paxillus rubicundulus Ve08.2h10 TaxID=930991 RepID=A0A0D0DCU4_9AGAM|nr:hypothetical protein PAXRUDRAFT_827363 [Paxillus rubicundulus Ve08.2h10]